MASVRTVSPLSRSAPFASGRCRPSGPATVAPPDAKSTRPAAALVWPAKAAETSAASNLVQVCLKGRWWFMASPMCARLEVEADRSLVDGSGELVQLDVRSVFRVRDLGD